MSQAGKGGAHSSGGAPGKGGASESAGAAGETVGTAGENGSASGGHTGTGGTGHAGSATASGGHAQAGEAGASPGTAGGEAGTGSTATPEWRADLPGPSDDSVTVLDASAVHTGESVFGCFVDADDAITVGGWNSALNNGHETNGFVAKLDADGAPVWTTRAQYPDPNTLSGNYGFITEEFAGNADGTAFVGGLYHPPAQYPTLPDETTLGGYDVAFGAFDANGNSKWLHQAGGSGDELSSSIAAGPDGSVYVFASIAGQLPGKSADLRNGPAVLKYDAAGNQVYATQYKNYYGPTGSMISQDNAFAITADADGNVYTSDFEGMTKLDPSGSKVWYGHSSSFDTSNAPVIPNVMNLGVSPSGRGLFAFGAPSSLAEVRQVPLQRWDTRTGRPLWIREPGTRKVTIDTVEGVIWDGAFVDSAALVVGDDAVYVTGRYSNSYENGSAARPGVTAAFVARYDFDGEQIWFKQFAVKASSSATTTTAPLPAGLALRPNGGVVFAGNTGQGWLVLKFKASDGSFE